ncbi:MAG TPA: glycine--tRNA ligase subunit beta [Casimicrobiaceae bacterium]|nr:glycine--tRNA ligase subunit beta [Casimicrobiaceae bacterium]
MSAATLLVELLTEELPPKALRKLGDAFASMVSERLQTRGFVQGSAEVIAYATPRRLAVTIAAVLDTATEAPRALPLLPVNVAFDAEGKPTPALQKAIKSKAGFDNVDAVPPDRLQRRIDGKLERLYYIEPPVTIQLRAALQEALDDAIDKLPIPKVMRYASADSYFNDVAFVRPAHKLIALHGEAIVPVESLGLQAGNLTDGHRFLSRTDICVANADAYAPTLEAEGKVLPSFAVRRHRIIEELRRAAQGALVMMPDSLLDEVTALVEWPVVLAGGFDEAFLEVPQECLVLTMQQNQKYFALADRNGALVNRFLLVSNLQTDDTQAIVHGNERVLRARLADAKFFYDQDRKRTLEDWIPRLANVVYHNKLGSQGQRALRLRDLAANIGTRTGADSRLCERGGWLAKADLVTDMVGEFPELQGTMGRYYALNDGEPAEVADAIAQHYWPRFAGDALPKGPVAIAVALADKLDALAGLFGVGEIPTGEKDPFGLRRAAIGILRILVEKELALSLRELIGIALAANFDDVPMPHPSAQDDLEAFLLERLRGLLREQGYSANQVAAVLDSRPDRVDDLPARLTAVKAFEAMPEAATLAAANKRIVNILKKSDEATMPRVDVARFSESAERDLHRVFSELAPRVAADCANGAYTSALQALATAKGAVDRFFDEVMVNVDDPIVRANRLALLRGVAATMNQVADIGKLAS